MIHYHGTPLSGPINTALSLQARHAFVSFAAPDQVEIVAEVCQSFALDNGAFSAWKRGAAMDVAGYLEFVRRWSRHPGFDFALIPDVIDGTARDNVEMLQAWPADLAWCGVPVWHLHESLEHLAWLVKCFRRLALGSSGEYAAVGDGKWWRRMAQALDVICDDQGRPQTQLHGLRMLDPTVFSHIPFSSADSTNVARNIGIDQAWRGPYVPRSQSVKALVLMDRIEAHGSASRWCRTQGAMQRDLELTG